MEIVIITMLYQLKKNDFLVTCQEQNGGTLVTVTRDNHPNQMVRFGLVTPGNLYMLSDDKWTLIDIKGIIQTTRKHRDHLERAADALSIAITRLPIGNSYLKLELGEFRLIEAIAYGIGIRQPLTWLAPAAVYYLGNGKMAAVTGTNVHEFWMPRTQEDMVTWDPRIGLAPLSKPSPPPNQPTTARPVTPQLVISPAVTPMVLQSPPLDGTPRIVHPKTGPVKVALNIIQKKPVPQGPLILPPITIKPDPNYNPEKASYENAKRLYPDFYAMAERRGQWKKDHPNWREEMYPYRKEDHERMLKAQAKLLERKRLEKIQLQEERERQVQEIIKKNQEKSEARERQVQEIIKKNQQQTIGYIATQEDDDTIKVVDTKVVDTKEEMLFSYDDDTIEMVDDKGKEEESQDDTIEMVDDKGKEEESQDDTIEMDVHDTMDVLDDDDAEEDDDDVDTVEDDLDTVEDPDSVYDVDTIEDPDSVEDPTLGTMTLPLDIGEEVIETTLPVEFHEDSSTELETIDNSLGTVPVDQGEIETTLPITLVPNNEETLIPEETLVTEETLIPEKTAPTNETDPVKKTLVPEETETTNETDDMDFEDSDDMDTMIPTIPPESGILTLGIDGSNDSFYLSLGETQ